MAMPDLNADSQQPANGQERLLKGLLECSTLADARGLIEAAAGSTVGSNLLDLLYKPPKQDAVVVGGKYGLACYIDSSWPVVLYLAHKYLTDPMQGLLQNTNLGGENCHRGAVLGTLLGAATGCRMELFDRLLHAQEIQSEIAAALSG